MKISIYGSGCKKCTKFYDLTQQAISELKLDCELEKVTDMTKIMEAGVMTVPAIGIDGDIKLSGNIPSLDEIKTILKF